MSWASLTLRKSRHSYAERSYSQGHCIMNEITVIGIDLAKSVFQVCVWMSDGSIVSNRKVSWAKLLTTISQFPAGSMIAMVACATSHYWGRTFQSMGFNVRLSINASPEKRRQRCAGNL